MLSTASCTKIGKNIKCTKAFSTAVIDICVVFIKRVHTHTHTQIICINYYC